jgi:site-specific DNA-cytosine methylase
VPALRRQGAPWLTGSPPRLRRIEDYPALLNEAWAQAHAPRAANAPTVISTFAGCGGSSLGYHMAGFRELLAVEWEQNAADTFRLNFPHVPLYHGDIAKLSVDECLRLAGVKPGELTVFDGSPPCQGFSTSGKREIGDARNQLFREYCRLLEGLRPRAFVMENVSGMVKGDFKIVFAEILRTLKRCGYRVKARLLNAMFFGVPQSRERMIFIGVRDDLGVEASHPAGWSEPVSLLSRGVSRARRWFAPASAPRSSVAFATKSSRTSGGRRAAGCTIVPSRPASSAGLHGWPAREMAPHDASASGRFPIRSSSSAARQRPSSASATASRRS